MVVSSIMVVLLLMLISVTAPTAVKSAEYDVSEQWSQVSSDIHIIQIPSVEEGSKVKCEWPLNINVCIEKMEAKEGLEMITEAKRKLKAMLKSRNNILHEGLVLRLNKKAEDMKTQGVEWEKRVKDIKQGKKKEMRTEDQHMPRKTRKKTDDKEKIEGTDRQRQPSAHEDPGQENMFQGKTKEIGNKEMENQQIEITKEEKGDERRNRLEEMAKGGGLNESAMRIKSNQIIQTIQQAWQKKKEKHKTKMLEMQQKKETGKVNTA